MSRAPRGLGLAALPLWLAATLAHAQPAPEAAPQPAPVAPAPAAPAAAPQPRVGELKPLGGERYQIGRIVLDKKARRFTVPGRVHVLGRPLEYLATSPGGMKEYEALLELDASGSEFNLACILLGLERDPTQGPYWQFSKEPLSGPRLDLRIAWREGGKRREVSAAEALLDPQGPDRPEAVEWVYMGSLINPNDGLFAADVTGTLVGFVHDANSIIESVLGLGIGAYGSVPGNPAKLPPVDSPIELIVTLPKPPASPSARPARP